MNSDRYSFPLGLLSEGSWQTSFDDDVADDMKHLIINTFAKCGIDISMVSYVVSPTVVRFEFIPQEGVKIKLIRSCEGKLNEALSDYGPVRLIAPVPVRGTIAVEVPRPDRQIVRLREVLESKEFQESEAHLPVVLGIDSENNTVVADLAKMPHLLIAGATGQGKSVLINNIILSLLYKLNPADLKLVLIDVKGVEFCPYDKINTQYLLGSKNDSPEVITSFENVLAILNAIVHEVKVRYNILLNAGCRNITDYNQRVATGKLEPVDSYPHLPYIVVVINEFADLKMILEKDFESPLLRIVARSKAVGIHMVIATQCLKTDVINGMLKANFPARISIKVNSMVDSKIILDTIGSEKPLGMGDMLLWHNGIIERAQSAFVSYEEIESVCDWVAKEFPKDNSYVLPVISESETFYKPASEERDSLFEEVAHKIVESQVASTSMLQRQFSIGYARACKLMSSLEDAGIVGPQNGRKPREVLKPSTQKNKTPFGFKRLINLLKFGKKKNDSSISHKNFINRSK